MITFVDGPHGEKISKQEQKRIHQALEKGSVPWQINEFYNNVLHFSSHKSYDIQHFLSDMSYIIENKHHQLQIMGGIHQDPFGHTSGMVGQFTQPYNEFIPCLVKDTYIRFKVHMDPNHFKIIKCLDHFDVFHYLVDVPYIEKLQLHPSVPVVMFPTHDHLLPKTRYKNSSIMFSQ